MINDEEYNNIFVEIDPTKFKVSRVVWFAGDSYTNPGYCVCINVGDDLTTMVSVYSDKYNPDWVITKDKS